MERTLTLESSYRWGATVWKPSQNSRSALWMVACHKGLQRKFRHVRATDKKIRFTARTSKPADMSGWRKVSVSIGGTWDDTWFANVDLYSASCFLGNLARQAGVRTIYLRCDVLE